MWAKFSQGRNVLVILDRKRPSDVVREFFWAEDGRRFVGDDNLESCLRSLFGSLPPTLEIVGGATEVSISRTKVSTGVSPVLRLVKSCISVLGVSV